MFPSTPCSGRGVRGSGGGGEGRKEGRGYRREEREEGEWLTPSVVPFSAQCWSLQQAAQREKVFMKRTSNKSNTLSSYNYTTVHLTVYHSTSQYITVYYSIPQYITVYHSTSQYTTVHHSIPQYIIVYHSIPQYITVYHTFPAAVPCFCLMWNTCRYTCGLFLTLLYFNTLCICTLPLQSSLYGCSYAMLLQWILAISCT